jgi:hypothetical protein
MTILLLQEMSQTSVATANNSGNCYALQRFRSKRFLSDVFSSLLTSSRCQVGRLIA